MEPEDDFEDDYEDDYDDEGGDNYEDEDEGGPIEVVNHSRGEGDKYDPEEDRERAKNLLQVPVGALASYFMSGPSRVSMWLRYMCHATFKFIPDDEIIASCFDSSDVPKGVGEKYWEFLSGKDSPWRDLFQVKPPEPILRPDKSVCGFFLEPTKAKEYSALAYNFAIAARMISEHPETITIWSEFCNEGVNPADAFFLSRMFSKEYVGPAGDGLKEDEYIFSGHMNNNMHWPIAESEPYWNNEVKKLRYFSFDAFRNGAADHEYAVNDPWGNIQSNRLWRRSLKKPEFKLKSLEFRVVKGPYSMNVEVFNKENIIEVFSKTLREDMDV